MNYIPVILGGIGGIVLIGYAYSLIEPKKNQTGFQPRLGGSKCKKSKKNNK